MHTKRVAVVQSAPKHRNAEWCRCDWSERKNELHTAPPPNMTASTIESANALMRMEKNSEQTTQKPPAHEIEYENTKPQTAANKQITQ